MACTGPLHGWMSREKTPLGKRRLSFSIREAFHDLPLTVPCGTCTACQLDRARAWAVRITHEAKMHKHNVFVTLTYREMPPHGSLRPRDFVLFMKKLRKRHPGVRFLQAGEYGKLGRPHHHAILFGCHFPDAKPFRQTSPGNLVYRSNELETLWHHGYSSIGLVTPASAAYVARYTLKKQQHQPNAPRHPPYITMSRNKGIGSTWLDKYYNDVYPQDLIITRDGNKLRPPRYYDERLKEKDPVLHALLKRERILATRTEANYWETGASRQLQKRTNIERRVTDYLKRNL